LSDEKAVEQSQEAAGKHLGIAGEARAVQAVEMNEAESIRFFVGFHRFVNDEPRKKEAFVKAAKKTAPTKHQLARKSRKNTRSFFLQCLRRQNKPDRK
jgi:cell division protein FtsN